MKYNGRFVERENNEKLVAITDSISYKMIAKDDRNRYTFAFRNISSKEAAILINSNVKHCVGAVGHYQFAKDLNRVLDINYTIPYGAGRERVHLTLTEGDYVIVVSRISNRSTTYDRHREYTSLQHPDDCMYTLAKVIETPETSFVIGTIGDKVEASV